MFSNQKMKNVMKAAVPSCLLLLVLLASNCSTNKDPNANAALSVSDTPKSDQRISLFDGRFSFVLPDGFKALPAAQIKRELADNESSDNIFSNESQTAYIKATFGDVPLEPGQLPEVKKFVEGTHKNYSGWKTSEIIEMNGRQWFYFEWEKPVADKNLGALVAPEEEANSEVKKDEKPVHYREYTTSLNKQKLSVVFETDAQVYPQVKEAFNKTVQTIQIKD